MKKPETRLAKVKTALILEHPFVGTIALSMPFEFDENIPTAATNGKRVKFNPKFIEKLTDEELKFLVAHECMHPMLEHNYRRGNRNHRKWNMAADYVINQILIEEGIGKIPKKGLYDPQIYAAGGGTSEGVYAILPEQVGNDDDLSDLLDNCEDGEGSPAEQAQVIAEWKIKVAQAAQAAKIAGKLSAGMSRLVDELLQPKVDWRDVLYRFLIRYRIGERSYARFNRRFVSQGLYLPSVSGEAMGEVVFAIDCSGSIDQHTLDQFAAEVRKAKDDLLPSRVHVVYFDSEVCHADSFEPYDELVIRPYGGGGTDYAPVFRWIAEQGIEPVAIVFLTDLECSSFGDEPDVPVLWVTTADGAVPFGEVVVMGE